MLSYRLHFRLLSHVSHIPSVSEEFILRRYQALESLNKWLAELVANEHSDIVSLQTQI